MPTSVRLVGFFAMARFWPNWCEEIETGAHASDVRCSALRRAQSFLDRPDAERSGESYWFEVVAETAPTARATWVPPIELHRSGYGSRAR